MNRNAAMGSPDDALSLARRGLALQDEQRFDEAVECYSQALRIRPLVGVFTNRGNALRSLRRFDAALEDLDAALRLKPDFPEALNNRGNVLRDLGRLEDALASFDATLALRPDFSMALCNRGNTLLDLKRPREALASFESALRLDPEDGEGLFGRAVALLRLRERLDLAVADFERAAKRGIALPETLVGKAAALDELRRHQEAAATLMELLAIAPDRDYARGSLPHSLQQICDWTNLPGMIDELERLVQAGRRVVDPQSFLSLSGAPELHLECARLSAADQYPPNETLGPIPLRTNTSRPGKIRVAYLSADLREHAASYLVAGVLERHDRDVVETFAISLRPPEDSAMGKRVVAAVDRFVDVSPRSDREVAVMMRDLEIDIAVDLMGYTQGCRPGILAYRAAPVQVNYLGYPATMGAPFIDYILADEFVIPPSSRQHYSEQVVYLPECFQANDDRCEMGSRPSRGAVGLPETGPVLCCFNNNYKLNPPLFTIWMRLLREMPGSVLWLLGDQEITQANLRREAAARGVEPGRLVFAGRIPYARHLGRLGLADLFLDTSPYGAGATASDALRTGVPVLTCPGRAFVSRMAGSLLYSMSLPELITANLAEYERKALELLREPQRLADLRARLEDKLSRAALFNTPRFTRHLETAYHAMHDRARRGLPPLAFHVPPLD